MYLRPPPKGLGVLSDLKPPRGLMPRSLVVPVRNIGGRGARETKKREKKKTRGKGNENRKKERRTEARCEEKRMVEERERRKALGGADPYL